MLLFIVVSVTLRCFTESGRLPRCDAGSEDVVGALGRQVCELFVEVNVT